MTENHPDLGSLLKIPCRLVIKNIPVFLSDEDINKIVINAGPSTPELNTPQEKVAFLYQLAQIAAADGEIDETEVLLLEKDARHYDFQEESISKISKHLVDKALKGFSETEVLTEIFN